MVGGVWSKTSEIDPGDGRICCSSLPRREDVLGLSGGPGHCDLSKAQNWSGRGFLTKDLSAQGHIGALISVAHRDTDFLCEDHFSLLHTTLSLVPSPFLPHLVVAC